MAHAKKFTKNQCGHMINHYNRKAEKDCNRSNENIDPDRTNQNYNLMQRDITPQEFLNNRLDEIYHIDRKDINVMVDWIITLPEELKNESIEKQKEFFTHTADFLNNRYGAENCIGAFVHWDETTPHMHYAFIPVVPDHKHKDYDYALNAKKVISRTELQHFHKDLQNHIREKMPLKDREITIYKGGKEITKSTSLENFKLEKELQKREEYQKKLEEKSKEIDIKRDNLNNKINTYNKDVVTYNESKNLLKEKKINFNKEVFEMQDKANRLQDIKNYFEEKDNFLEQSGITEYAYERTVHLYENQIPGYELPIIQTAGGLWYAEPELQNPFRDIDERERLQTGFNKFAEPEHSHSHERNHDHDYER